MFRVSGSGIWGIVAYGLTGKGRIQDYGRLGIEIPLRVHVPSNHILTLNQYYNYYYPKPKDLIIGYMDPLGSMTHRVQSKV